MDGWNACSHFLILHWAQNRTHRTGPPHLGAPGLVRPLRPAEAEAGGSGEAPGGARDAAQGEAGGPVEQEQRVGQALYRLPGSP